MAASLVAPSPGRSPPAHTAGMRTCKTCKRARPSGEFYRGPWEADPREGTYRPSCQSCATISAQLPRQLAPPRLRPPFGHPYPYPYQVLYSSDADPVEEIREKILAQLRVQSIPEHPLQAPQLSARADPAHPGSESSSSTTQAHENLNEFSTTRPDQATSATVSDPAEPPSGTLKRALPDPLKPHSEPGLHLARPKSTQVTTKGLKKKTTPRALQAINSHSSSRRQKRCLPTMGPVVKPRSPLTMWADHQFRFGLKL